jgi:hypothetical protein
MAPSDSSRRRDGLGCRLVLPVAVAVRSPWGLPCSARSVVRVPSLIPRRSPSLRVSSGFTAGAAFARSGGARPPQLCYGATCRFTGVTARVLAPPGLRRGPRGSCAAGRATCVDDRSHGEPPSAHAERAALHGAPRAPDIPPRKTVRFFTRLGDRRRRISDVGWCGLGPGSLDGVCARKSGQFSVRTHVPTEPAIS